MSVNMVPLEIKGKTRAIVCFGPATDVTGNRPAEFFQVVIDPAMVSPSGEYIRFDQRDQTAQNEIHGWQRVSALTVCEVLEEGPENDVGKTVIMRAIEG